MSTLSTSNLRRAFTLIELLVVVSIIALLMAILLTSLGSARRIARTAVCATNLRGIAGSMATYAADWNNAILGNAHTSSCSLYNGAFTGLAPGISESNVPELISTNDWLTPTARQMDLSFDNGPSMLSRIARFMTFNAFKGFTCPENDVLAGPGYTGNGGPNFPAHRVVSYTTALCFQYVQGPAGSASNGFNNQVLMPASFSTLSLGSYRPKTTLVGNPSDKVYMADSARFYTSAAGAIAIDDNAALQETSPGGLTSDYGPWDSNNRAYSFKGGTSGDGRTASMRHGSTRNRGNSLSAFKFNLAFFDAHVETMNGLDGADPSLWIPTGGSATGNELITYDAAFKQRYGMKPPIR